jgi:uncharacterized protein (DUF1330 family)
MSAYVVVTERVTDEKGFDEYRSAVVDTLVPFKGRFLIRGGRLSVIEGEWPMPRLVVIEFASREAAEGWYRSPAYQKIVPLRLKSAVGNLVIVDGA